MAEQQTIYCTHCKQRIYNTSQAIENQSMGGYRHLSCITCIYCGETFSNTDELRVVKNTGYAHDHCKALRSNQFLDYKLDNDALQNILTLLTEAELKKYNSDKTLPLAKVKQVLDQTDDKEAFKKYLFTYRLKNYAQDVNDLQAVKWDQAKKLRQAVKNEVVRRSQKSGFTQADINAFSNLNSEKMPASNHLIYGELGQQIISPLLKINDLESIYQYKQLEPADVVVNGEPGLYGYDSRRIYYSFKYTLDPTITRDTFQNQKNDLWYYVDAKEVMKNAGELSNEVINSLKDSDFNRLFYRRMMAERIINSQKVLEYLLTSNDNKNENGEYKIPLFTDLSNLIMLDGDDIKTTNPYCYTTGRKYYMFQYIHCDLDSKISVSAYDNSGSSFYYEMALEIKDKLYYLDDNNIYQSLSLAEYENPKDFFTITPIYISLLPSGQIIKINEDNLLDDKIKGRLYYINEKGKYCSVSSASLTTNEDIKNFLESNKNNLYVREMVEANKYGYGKITSQTILNKYYSKSGANWDSATSKWKMRLYTHLDNSTVFDNMYNEENTLKYNKNGYQIVYADAYKTEQTEATHIPSIFSYQKLKGMPTSEDADISNTITNVGGLVEGLVSLYQTEPLYLGGDYVQSQGTKQSNCKSNCMGLCTDACTGTCSTGCKNTCGGTCKGSCSGKCSGCKGGCSSCRGSCRGGCKGGCSSCGTACSSCGSCGNQCTGCYGGCKHTAHANGKPGCGGGCEGCGTCGGRCSGSYNEI